MSSMPTGMVVSVLNGLNSNELTAVLTHISSHGTSRGLEQMVQARHDARGQDQLISQEAAAAEEDIASAIRIAQQQLGPFSGAVTSGGVTTRRQRRQPPGTAVRNPFDIASYPRMNSIVNGMNGVIARLPTVISYFESESNRPGWPPVLHLDADPRSSAPTACGDDGVDRAVDSEGGAVWRPSTEDKCITTGMICPITHSVFVDPVVAPDGHTYERSAIKKWFATGKNTSPVTNESFVGSPRLLPNHGLRNTIDEIIKKNYPDQAAGTQKKISANAPKGVSKRKHRSR
jgi:hypothetical protein